MKEEFQQVAKDTSHSKITQHIRHSSIAKVGIAPPSMELEHQDTQLKQESNQRDSNGRRNSSTHTPHANIEEPNYSPSKLVPAPAFVGLESPLKRKSTDPEPLATGKYVGIDTKTTEDLCFSLGISRRDVQKLKRKFDEADLEKTNEITQEEFFALIHEDKRALTFGIFAYCGLNPSLKRLNFDMYLRCVVTFASFTKLELLKYVFDQLDQDHSGLLDVEEVIQMGKHLQDKQFFFGKKNVGVAMRKLSAVASPQTPATAAVDDRTTRRRHSDGSTQNALLDLENFTRLTKHYAVAFYPIIQLQTNIRQSTLGESYWDHAVESKVRVKELVRYLDLHGGSLPELTWKERLVAIYDNTFSLRRRAYQLYAQNRKQNKTTLRKIEGPNRRSNSV